MSRERKPPVLLPEEYHALWQVAVVHKQWKHHVRIMWADGNYRGFNAQVLQALRNRIGPNGLYDVKRQDLQENAPNPKNQLFVNKAEAQSHVAGTGAFLYEVGGKFLASFDILPYPLVDLSAR